MSLKTSYEFRMSINCGKSIGCLLENQTIENFITPFVTNIVFHNVGLSLIIQSNQKPNFDFKHHYHYCILDVPWYNTMICLLLHVFPI